jgi:hypothetical protein
MLGLNRFDYDGEGNLRIELSFVKAGDIKQILDLLIKLGAVTEEDIVNTTVIEVDSENYTFVKCNEDGKPIIDEEENDSTEPPPQAHPEQKQLPPSETPPRKPKDRTMQQKILEALSKGEMTIKELTKEIYGEEKMSGTSEYQHVYDRLMFRLMPDGQITRERTPEKFNTYVYRLAQSKAPDSEAQSAERPKQATGRERMEEAKKLIQDGMAIEATAEKVWGKPAHRLGDVIKRLREQLDLPKTDNEAATDDTFQQEQVFSVLAENGPMSSDDVYERFPSWSEAHTLSLLNKLRKAGRIENDDGLWKVTFEGKKEEICDLLATGKFTIQDILENIFEKQCATSEPEYRFLMEVLGKLESKGLLGKAKDNVGTRLYYIEGADQAAEGYM